ncbi:hypothetical protein CEXT_92921 [Caerostris extrusa]|uniref:Uncharacterized protein n=1 Tax=Caerostris extrusa TaxID=172846 RepID=A0AAV4NZ87_CAEEX|nr:hypothetical protein CEXT_92921 [Caerostris extrusa]
MEAIGSPFQSGQLSIREIQKPDNGPLPVASACFLDLLILNELLQAKCNCCCWGPYQCWRRGKCGTASAEFRCGCFWEGNLYSSVSR